MSRPMQNYNEVLDWLLDADQRFPIADWRIGEIDIWPLARAMLAVALQGEVPLPGIAGQARAEASPPAVRLREAQAIAKLRRFNRWRSDPPWLGALTLDVLNQEGKGPALEPDVVKMLNANRLPNRAFEGEGAARWLFVGNANLTQV